MFMDERTFIIDEDVETAIKVLEEAGAGAFYYDEVLFENDIINDAMRQIVSEAVWEVATERLSDEDYEEFIRLVADKIRDAL